LRWRRAPTRPSRRACAGTARKALRARPGCFSPCGCALVSAANLPCRSIVAATQRQGQSTLRLSPEWPSGKAWGRIIRSRAREGETMKATSLIGISAILLFCSAASAQSAFGPLARWTAAVQSGNEANLAALYTTVPPAQTQTPHGITADPREEPRFWSALAASGLSDFQTKVLAVEHREGGAIELVLRIGGKIRTSAGEQPFVVAVHQRWIHEDSEWRIFATRRDDLAASPVMRLPEPPKPNIALYAPPEEARSEIAAAL